MLLFTFRHLRTTCVSRCLLAFGIAICCSPALAKRTSDEARKTELFAGMENDLISVEFIPLNAHKANVLVENLTDQPLNVRLPDAFAGVPILAQGQVGGFGLGNGGGFGQVGAGQGGGGGGQTVGGGGGLGNGGGGQGGGGQGFFFRVAPNKTSKIAVKTVCLEHGKPDPRPKMEYKIAPLTTFSSDPALHRVCEALGTGQVSTNVAQAAAWNLTDGLSWNELAQINRRESKYTGTQKFFSTKELHTAQAFVNTVQSESSSNASTEFTTSKLRSESYR
ncbi:MAG: hypothetical protein AAF989_06180 [Planctomycetota bacterium]